MKTIHLNLAARPYRDYSKVYAVATILGIAAAVLMLYNIQTAYDYLVETKATRATIDELTAEAARERSATDTIKKRISAIDTARLDGEAKYVNQQIAERAFSWSVLLDRLERVTPANVHMNVMNPTIGKDGRVSLTLTCISKDSEGMVRLITRMIDDPYFDNPFPGSESALETGEYAFNLSVTYLPGDAGVTR